MSTFQLSTATRASRSPAHHSDPAQPPGPPRHLGDHRTALIGRIRLDQLRLGPVVGTVRESGGLLLQVFEMHRCVVFTSFSSSGPVSRRLRFLHNNLLKYDEMGNHYIIYDDRIEWVGFVWNSLRYDTMCK